MSFGFAPKGWAFCNGQLLPINQNQALFSLLGHDLRRRRARELRAAGPAGPGADPRRQGHTLGERGGEQAHTLSIAELPTHTHAANAANVAPTAGGAEQHARARRSRRARTCTPQRGNLVDNERRRARNVGGSQAHLNMQPFLTLNFCIALQGIFPSAELRRDAMAQPYVGEIRMFAGNFAPAGWMFCEGQLLPISENETLFNLIGTTYGGDGQSTFALPDLRGRIPVHQGNGFTLAETGGAETITLTVKQIPAHSHPFLATTSPASSPSPTNQVPGSEPGRHDHALRSGQSAAPAIADQREHRGRQSAAHQLPALPVRRLHHLALRDLPEPDLGAQWRSICC